MRNRRGRPPHPDVLTPREWEVLSLLRENLPNEAIAERLGITLAGAKYHVSEILSKLGVNTREEAARWQPEEPRARAGRLLAGALGLAVMAAAIAGLALLAWGVSRAGDGETADGGERPVGATACLAALADFPLKADGIRVFSFRDAVCWEDTQGESSYALETTVQYYADCEVWHERGDLALEPITSEVSVRTDATSARLPPTPDERYPHPKDVTVSLRALDRDGSEVATGGFAIQRELDYPAMCDATP